jgi:hypothetical protein
MISSYLVIFASQSILQHNSSHLLDLIRFRLRPLRLQVQDFFNTCPGKDVVITANPLVKPQAAKQLAQLGERDIGIGPSAQDTIQQLIPASHTPPGKVALQLARIWRDL